MILGAGAIGFVLLLILGKAVFKELARSFFPLTFPLTTGPGTIAAAIALGAQIPSNPVLFVAGAAAAATGALIVAIALYLLFANAAAVLKWLGPIGSMVMIRLMAFILLCIGIQIILNGAADAAATIFRSAA